MLTRSQPSVTHYEYRRWGLAAGMLLAMGCVQIALYRPPPQTAAYFQKVLAEVAATPTQIAALPNPADFWVSSDSPIPPGAVGLLKPNFTLSRQFHNNTTGQQVSILLVQCLDAQSLQGHYPPVCYKASGMKQVSAVPKHWTIDGLPIQGVVYKFTNDTPESLSAMLIYDFMILPNGRTCPDMEGVSAIARDKRKSKFGAAQMQIIFDPSMPEEQRETLFATFIRVHRRIIDAILAGEQS